MIPHTYRAAAIVTVGLHVKIGSDLRSHTILSGRTFYKVVFEILLPTTEVDLGMEETEFYAKKSKQVHF